MTCYNLTNGYVWILPSITKSLINLAYGYSFYPDLIRTTLGPNANKG